VASTCCARIVTVEAAQARTRRLTAVRREEARVTALELFFDLVFVLALTQCTALIAATPIVVSSVCSISAKKLTALSRGTNVRYEPLATPPCETT